MSSTGFHVHGPHDHEIEHAAQAGHGSKDPFASRTAVITAVLATIGAFFGYMGGATQTDAALFKNNAALKKTEASNQWNYFQAKSSKQNLAEIAIVLVPDDRKAAYQQEVERYKREKAEIQVAAEKLERESKTWDAKSDAKVHEHHRWAQATTGLQVAIALAAITLLTRRRWMERLMIAAAVAGAALGVAAALHL